MRALIVDDAPVARRQLRSCLAGIDSLELHEAGSLTAARQALASNAFDVVFIDLCLNGIDRTNRDGLTLLRDVHENSTAVPIVVTVSTAMVEIREAMRHGAYAYILKDELCEELVGPIVRQLRDRRTLEQGVLELHGLVGTSPAMERLRRTIRQVAAVDGPALIFGATGSGKELVARAIHALSSRKAKSLVTVNCGAITESLADAQLFGHEKGFFTGADKARPGFMGEASGGTLFLDEVAELAPAVQAKLLRVLENRTFRRLGSATDQLFDGRVLAATHVDLDGRQKEGRFRADLYYRLEVLTVRVPALDEHKEDIPALVEHFAREVPRPLRFSDGAKEALMRLRWPGNVRELRNLIHRLSVFVEADIVEAADVLANKPDAPAAAAGRHGASTHQPGLLAGISLHGTKKQNTLRLIQNQIRLLEAEGATVEEVCRILEVSRSSLFRLKSGHDDSDR